MQILARAIAAAVLVVGLLAQPAQSRTNTLQTGQYASEAEAQSHCSGNEVVWLNTKSHVYHISGAKKYGHTKHGAYMCRPDADRMGRPAKNEKPRASAR